MSYSGIGTITDQAEDSMLRETQAKVKQQPIMTTSSQIFTLDTSGSAATWVEQSSQLINVHLFHDSARQLYRLISVQGSKPVLNLALSRSLVINKASSKFLQLVDQRNTVVFGLGFMDDRELTKVVAKLTEVQNMMSESASESELPTAFESLLSSAKKCGESPEASCNDDECTPTDRAVLLSSLEELLAEHKQLQDVSPTVKGMADLRELHGRMANKLDELSELHKLMGTSLTTDRKSATAESALSLC